MSDSAKLKSKVANFASRSEKTSWKRKATNLEKFISENITPLEQQKMELSVDINKHHNECIRRKQNPLYDARDVEKYVEDVITPLEEQRLELMVQILQQQDVVIEMRREMATICVHPLNDIRSNLDETVTCTFCGRTFK